MRERIFVIALCLLLSMTPFLFAGEIHDAVKAGNLANVKAVLSKNPSLINSFDTEDEHLTPLHYATEKKHLEVAKYLISKGANVNSRERDMGCAPIHFAAQEGSYEIVKLLIDNGSSPKMKDKFGDTPLHWAAGSPWKNKNMQLTVELLIKRGANIAARDDSGMTPLMKAEMSGNKVVADVIKRISK